MSTSRLHANQSADSRFLFARQDQTAASLAFHKVGYQTMYEQNIFSMYQQDNVPVPNSVYFLMRGM